MDFTSAFVAIEGVFITIRLLAPDVPCFGRPGPNDRAPERKGRSKRLSRRQRPPRIGGADGSEGPDCRSRDGAAPSVAGITIPCQDGLVSTNRLLGPARLVQCIDQIKSLGN